MKIFKYNIALVLVALLIGAISMFSCDEGDEYLEYTKGGEILYTGKIDSLKIFPGRFRVEVEGLIISDPKVSELRVYWNTKSDSVVVPINRTSGVDEVSSIIDNLAENIYNFEVRTFDAEGNNSVAQFVTQEVFGERYQESLTNRPITSTNLVGETLTINFASMDRTTGVYGTEIVYTDASDVEQTQFVSIEDSDVEITSYKSGSTFTYRSLFLPTEDAIDIFYSEDSTLTPEVI